MKIRVETTDALSNLLPGGTESTTLDITADNASPNDVLSALEIPAADGYLLIVNEAIVPKARRDDPMLNDGDLLQILPPLKGG